MDAIATASLRKASIPTLFSLYNIEVNYEEYRDTVLPSGPGPEE